LHFALGSVWCFSSSFFIDMFVSWVSHFLNLVFAEACAASRTNKQ
jgi:hypothetical protein